MTAEQERELAILLVKGQEGDGVAYREFLDRASHYVRQVVARRLSPAQTVEDVVQETLLSLHSARHTFLPGRPVVPWIHAITQRRVFDHLRKWMRNAEARTAQPFDSENAAFGAAEPEATSGMVLRDALANLSPQQRDVLELLKVDGLSTREVSEKLHVSEASVRVTAHRAYEKFKSYLLVKHYGNE